MPQLACGDVNDREPLLEEGVFNFAGLWSFGDERAGRTRGVFGEEDGDRFVVWGEERCVEETFYMREFSWCAAVCGDNVELLLIFFDGVCEKREIFAVVGPGDVAFGVECGGESGGDADWGGIGFYIFHIHRGVAVGGAVFAGESFDPGDVGAVGRDFGFGEAVRGAEGFDDVVDFGCG